MRIADNRALAAAASSGKPVIPVFIFDEESPGIRPIGAARRWWTHHSLTELAKSISSPGARLVLRKGGTWPIVEDLVKTANADLVLWNRRYDPPAVEVDRDLKSQLKKRGIAAESFDGQLLYEPWTIRTGKGDPYRVYTPFWRTASSSGDPRDPADAPKTLRPFEDDIASDTLDDWALTPTKPDWTGGLRDAWTPGEQGARDCLAEFADSIGGYGKYRDFPDHDATSRLSPHLAHGEITPFQIWRAIEQCDGPALDREKFRKELGWREFSWHLLFHQPDLASKNFNADFDTFPWRGSVRDLTAWRRGQTGYPIVDAGMRQLWRTGWMHNRVRMVVASFLSKHLLIDWRDGEAWFWDTLVDADPANNPASWQWVAGSGADAAPYFRIFNPILQGRKFDPDGKYVRRFVPELEELPNKNIHEPDAANRDTLSRAGVKLGKTYPVPSVGHKAARQRALQAYSAMRGNE